MQILRIIISWVILWFGSWYGWILLLKKGINYVKTLRIAIFYFLFLSLISYLFYQHHLYLFFSHLPFKLFPIYLLVTFFVISTGIYYFSRRIFDKKVLSSHLERKILAAMMDYRFLLAKSFDILFQQLLFLILVISLREVIPNKEVIILVAGFVFCIVHLPLLVIKYNVLSTYFVVASFFAGLLFSSLILSLPYGFIYSYILHWCFYLFVGIAYNISFIRNMKRQTTGIC